MATASQQTSNLPQGFSVFQPALGVQLEFFPAVGTQELDDLLNAYLPGPATIQDKRTSVAFDFFEHSRLTGDHFKFYQVCPLDSPVPARDSGYSTSMNVSPIMTYAWSQTQTCEAPSLPSTKRELSTSKRPSNRTRKAGRFPGQQTIDFAHHPGMKIMTKDGRDVTNSASRGSKTKEQRDHAHLMRVIKACDTCRRRKTRCDPSHKRRRVASQAQPPSTAKPAKKAQSDAQKLQPSPSLVDQHDYAPLIDSSAAEDPCFSTTPTFNVLDSAQLSSWEPWEELIQYPPVMSTEDYDFFTDPDGYLSPPSSSSASASPSKSIMPTSQREVLATTNFSSNVHSEPSDPSPRMPFDQFEPVNDYVDFNLFSPQSDFSEDDRMIPIELSSSQSSDCLASSLPNAQQNIEPDYPPVDWEDPNTVAHSGDLNFSEKALPFPSGKNDRVQCAPHEADSGLATWNNSRAPTGLEVLDRDGLSSGITRLSSMMDSDTQQHEHAHVNAVGYGLQTSPTDQIGVASAAPVDHVITQTSRTILGDINDLRQAAACPHSTPESPYAVTNQSQLNIAVQAAKAIQAASTAQQTPMEREQRLGTATAHAHVISTNASSAFSPDDSSLGLASTLESSAVGSSLPASTTVVTRRPKPKQGPKPKPVTVASASETSSPSSLICPAPSPVAAAVLIASVLILCALCARINYDGAIRIAGGVIAATMMCWSKPGLSTDKMRLHAVLTSRITERDIGGSVVTDVATDVPTTSEALCSFLGYRESAMAILVKFEPLHWRSAMT